MVDVATALGSPRIQKLEAWLERALAHGCGRLLGRGYQAEVYRFESPLGTVVVKMAHRVPFMRRIGMRTLEREAATYERLRGVPGVPRSFGLLHGHLVLEHVDGISVRWHEHERKWRDRELFYARLLTTIEAMHAAGIAHGDLKRKANILVGPEERPYVVDFGVAWQADPDAPRWRRAVFDLLRQMDYNAWIKLKYRGTTANLAPDDAAKYRPLAIERIARGIRIPWRWITFRWLRERRQKLRDRASPPRLPEPDSGRGSNARPRFESTRSMRGHLGSASGPAFEGLNAGLDIPVSGVQDEVELELRELAATAGIPVRRSPSRSRRGGWRARKSRRRRRT